MEVKKELNAYQQQMKLSAREERIRETIHRSKEAFTVCEQTQSINNFEFLISQFRLIRKRWWLLQMFLLSGAMIVLPCMQNKASVVRMLGVLGVLFVVLLIPEFWKNRSFDCMQIEGTCFYSLRQIYAARMFLFGITDLVLLTSFCAGVRGALGIVVELVLIQFVFPMLVAACICLGTLCIHVPLNEGAAVFGCLLWSVIWCVIILNEAVYAAITIPMWHVLFGSAVVFLSGIVYKTIHDCNQYWEVDFGGITTN